MHCSKGVTSCLLSISGLGFVTTTGAFCDAIPWPVAQAPTPTPPPKRAAPAPAIARVDTIGAGHGCSMVMKTRAESAMGAA